MKRTATFYNATCPQLVDQLKARGYVDFTIKEVIVTMDAEFGPIEYKESFLPWVEHVLLLVLVVYLLCNRRHR